MKEENTSFGTEVPQTFRCSGLDNEIYMYIALITWKERNIKYM